MEQRSKRRRLSQQAELITGFFESEHRSWPQLQNGVVVEEGFSRKQEYLPPKSLRISSGSGLPANRTRRSTYGDKSPTKVIRRDLGEDESPELPLRTAIASLVQVVVDVPEKPLTNLLVPPGSSILPLEGFGTLTVDTGPSPSLLLPSQSKSAVVSSLAFSASSSVRPARSSIQPASSAQQSLSSQPRPSSVPNIFKTAEQPSFSTTVAKPSSPSLTSLKINLPRPDSQVVLASPPSTPVPSYPPSSVLSDSTGSFHSTLSAISVSSPSSRDTQISSPLTTSSRPIKPNFLIASATRDSSSATSSSRPNTTSTSKDIRLSETSNSDTKSSSISTPSSAIKRSASATPSSSSRSQSHTAFITSRTKSPTSSSITSTSILQSLTSSSLFPTTSTDAGIIGGGQGGSGDPAGTISASAPSETTQPAGSGSSTRVASPTVIGGVVGGVAGLTIFCAFAIFLLYRRRKRQKRNFGPQPQAASLPPDSAGQDVSTTERSSTAPLAAAAFLKRLRPQSGQTAATTDTTPSERGFQNFGGRKLESVLSSRGDGYSEPGMSPGMVAVSSFGAGPSSGPRRPPGFGHSPGPSEPDTISGSSFFRDSQGWHGGNDGDVLPSSSSVRAGSNATTSVTGYPIPPESGLPPEGFAGFGSGDTEIAVMRPSPARTPVTGGFAAPPPRSPRNLPSPRSPGTPISRGHRDGLGRSHPSFDGSRGSRFTEDM